MRRTATIASSALIASLAAVGLASATLPASAAPEGLRDVMLVGNNWAGTATIVDANTRQILKTGVNFIPDKAQEIADIKKNPDQLAFYYLIQQGPGEGH